MTEEWSGGVWDEELSQAKEQNERGQDTKGSRGEDLEMGSSCITEENLEAATVQWASGAGDFFAEG